MLVSAAAVLVTGLIAVAFIMEVPVTIVGTVAAVVVIAAAAAVIVPASVAVVVSSSSPRSVMAPAPSRSYLVSDNVVGDG
jgi:hypothetical protein